MISNGFVIGLILCALLALGSISAIVIGHRLAISPKRDTYDDRQFGGKLVRGIGVAVLVLVVLGFAGGFYPYDMQYHRYQRVEGTVASIESRLLAEGKGTSQNYAVAFTEASNAYRCDDSRCSLVRPGDWLALWCIREWQYASTPGWVCNYADSRKASGR